MRRFVLIVLRAHMRLVQLSPFDGEDVEALARIAVVGVLATGAVAWAAGMVVLVRLIVGV